jgi:hypothetical protein
MQKPKTVTRQEWLTELRSHKGARFQHMGRSLERMDCIGLLIVSGTRLGIFTEGPKITGYSHMPDSMTFDTLCYDHMDRTDYQPGDALCNRLQPGDAITLWIEKRGVPRHIVVYTGKDSQGRETMIHSYAQERRGVIEMPIDPTYLIPRIHACWKIRGVV